MIVGLAGLLLLLSWQYPNFFSMKELASIHQSPYFSLVIQGFLALGFLLACINLMLRRNQVLGFSAICVVFFAPTLGEIGTMSLPVNTNAHLGLDWFVLNLLLTGLLFVPLEKVFGRLTDQPLFRNEWREDYSIFC